MGAPLAANPRAVAQAIPELDVSRVTVRNPFI